ncbi:Fibrocystin-L-like protein [Rhodotorula toruloides ATCC 204091]|uniref:Fibrocystin-L-like protein n=1 Tax=Rhodotorula toruloides TaxID=5286 RepID=A0A0K3CPR8_RHOTO|nr:Fibrocystin-L-like protein [Rhodotorula toruloides ATCC 204091]PRQ71053.1 Fibrocystin-L-like protein [Rhodotorula toruloides]
MHALALAAASFAAFAGFAAARPGNDVLVAHAVRSLAKRAGSSPTSSSSYLSEIFGMVTTQCQSTCGASLQDLTSCSNMTTQATIAACACSSVTLGDLRSCSSCISTTTRSDSNATTVVSAYNSYVDLCTQEGLATVTGTVEVGASTKAMSRAASTASVTSIPSSLVTYNPSSKPASTATVPSLVASGSIASSARVAAASGSISGSAASATPSKTSGAGRTAMSAAAGLLAVAAGMVIVA